MQKTVFLISLWIFLSVAGFAMGQQDAEYYLHEALRCPTRDDEVAFLKQALETLPPHPDNVSIEYQIASLLQTHTSPGQSTKPEEALEWYEHILATYNYDDYYVANFYAGAGWKKLKQSIMVQAAIQAGGLYNFVRGEGSKGREYQYLALEMLNNTYKRRLEDWTNEPDPPKPSEPTEAEIENMKLFGKDPASVMGVYQLYLKEAQERRRLAAEGDVFEEQEYNNARIAVRHYGLSFGRQSPEMVPIAMKTIIEDFPGTPMAEIAQGHIERASKMATQGIIEEGVEKVFDVESDQTNATIDAKFEEIEPSTGKSPDDANRPKDLANTNIATATTNHNVIIIVLAAVLGCVALLFVLTRITQKTE